MRELLHADRGAIEVLQNTDVLCALVEKLVRPVVVMHERVELQNELLVLLQLELQRILLTEQVAALLFQKCTEKLEAVRPFSFVI